MRKIQPPRVIEPDGPTPFDDPAVLVSGNCTRCGLRKEQTAYVPLAVEHGEAMMQLPPALRPHVWICKSCWFEATGRLGARVHVFESKLRGMTARLEITDPDGGPLRISKILTMAQICGGLMNSALALKPEGLGTVGELALAEREKRHSKAVQAWQDSGCIGLCPRLEDFS